MGIFTSAELVAAVSNAGGIGILGGASRPLDNLVEEVKKVRQLTNRPFGVNFLVTNYLEEAFQHALDAKVPLVSTALGDPGGLVRRVHDAGALYMHQVHTRTQARQAKERGVDLIVAQGSEAGGYGQWVSTLPLIPQVVDAVRPVPVLAAGGIADGRGVAAALVLGAEGAVMGTRFLASTEAPIGDEWKKVIISSESESTTKVEFINDLLDQGKLGYGTVPRALGTDFIQKHASDREYVRKNRELILGEMMQGVMKRQSHLYIPFTGQTTGLIRDILPAGEIVRRVVAEARSALDRAPRVGVKAPAA